ncbi:hypothetical protein ACFVZH_22685 [Streptomyces sp. NPDC059534]|uniref:hypothetical protein n=1 Tax=Streptomyces sp. NPDC059534 TaxID=3346859 RepID=UPI003678B3E3
MNARRVAAAGIAADLEAACLLQSPDSAAELAALRARIAELEAERHSTNEALDDAVKALRVQRDRVAELEAGLNRLACRMRRGQHWRDGRVVSEQTISQREIRHLTGLPLTPPPEDEYQYCGADLGRTEFPFTCYRRVAHNGPCAPTHDATPAEQPEDVSPQVAKLRGILARQRAATAGELAEQRHLMDPLDHTLEVLAPRSTTTIETSGSAL